MIERSMILIEAIVGNTRGDWEHGVLDGKASF
jgi:hypothetical protein